MPQFYQPNPNDSTPIGKVLAALARADRRINRTGPEKYMAQCPGPNHANGDQHPSLSIGIGKAGGCVMRCMSAGCPNERIVDALGLAMADLMDPDPLRTARASTRRSPALAKNGGGGKVYNTMGDAVKGAAWIMAKAHNLAADRVTLAGTWEYQNAVGEIVAAVVRVDLPTVGEDGKPDKDFRPVHCVAGGGGWRIGDPAAKWPLYKLPDVLAAVKTGARRVYVVEGEKACDAAWACGLVATTSAHGAKSPGKTDWMPLAGLGVEVVILPDNDEAGRGYADAVAGILAGLAPALAVKAVDLPDLPAKGDFYDFQAACRDGQDAESIRAEVDALADSAPAWEGAGVDAQQTEAPADVSAPVLVRLSDVAPVPVRWLWPWRIAIGKVTMFAGDPGLGKSFLTLDMAARVSTGRAWPDCPTILNPAGGVVLLNCEDDLADTIRPRLDRAGADCDRIIALEGVRLVNGETGEATERAFSLDRDLPRLEAAILAAPGCRLVVIDPITAYLGETDSHKNAEIRALLAPLGEIASRLGVAVVCVSHLNKGNGPAMYRTMGSLAFVAAARAAWAVTRDKDDPTGTRRLVLPVKNNLGPDNTGLAYALVDGAVRWEPEPVTVTADEALAQDSGGEDQGEDTELAHATDWLRDLLKPSPMLAKEVFKQARECGISERTANRAKREAGVEAYRPVNPGPWFWRMPGSTLPSPTTPLDVGNVPHVGNVPVNTGVCDGGKGADCQGGNNGKVPPAGVLAEGILEAPPKPKRKRNPIPDAGMRMLNTAGGSA